MIQVRCSICDQTFEADDASAGKSEFCPSCGTLNDVPAVESQNLSVENSLPALVATPPKDARGSAVWRGLWWITVLAASAAFVVACISLLRPNWESQNLNALADLVKKADLSANAGDFNAAIKQYQTAIDLVGTRTIESDFIRDLIARAHRGQEDAIARRNAKPATAPAVMPSTEPAVVPGEAQVSTDEAIRDFQRDSEGFAEFVAGKSVVFRDENGQWRRRRLIVYDIVRDLRLQADPPSITLRYTCDAHTTQPRDKKSDVASDGDFNVADPVGSIHCQTYFALKGNTWTILRRQRDNENTPVPWLDDLYAMEDQAFAAR